MIQTGKRCTHDAFGNVLLDTNPGFQPFGFQSGHYDPDTSRWLSKDPILLEGGFNLYAFCGNDPVNFADPWGLAERDSVWKAAALGFMEGLSRGAGATVDGMLTAATVDGLLGLFDPNICEGTYYDKEDSDARISHGLGQVSVAIATVAFALPQGMSRGATQVVTHWGPEGMTGLRSGDWVMTGGRTTRNWIMSGAKYSRSSTITETVSKSALKPVPKTEPFHRIKNLIGQRIYEP